MNAIQEMIAATNQSDLGLTLDLHMNQLGAGALMQVTFLFCFGDVDHAVFNFFQECEIVSALAVVSCSENRQKGIIPFASVVSNLMICVSGLLCFSISGSLVFF
jgi:hypothetical protein